MKKRCRLCLQYSHNSFNIKYVSRSGFSISDALKCLLPELCHDLPVNTVICMQCYLLLHQFYKFRLKCLTTEKIIDKFLEETQCRADAVCLDVVVDWYEQVKAEGNPPRHILYQDQEETVSRSSKNEHVKAAVDPGASKASRTNGAQKVEPAAGKVQIVPYELKKDATVKTYGKKLKEVGNGSGAGLFATSVRKDSTPNELDGEGNDGDLTEEAQDEERLELGLQSTNEELNTYVLERLSNDSSDTPSYIIVSKPRIDVAASTETVQDVSETDGVENIANAKSGGDEKKKMIDQILRKFVPIAVAPLSSATDDPLYIPPEEVQASRDRQRVDDAQNESLKNIKCVRLLSSKKCEGAGQDKGVSGVRSGATTSDKEEKKSGGAAPDPPKIATPEKKVPLIKVRPISLLKKVRTLNHELNRLPVHEDLDGSAKSIVVSEKTQKEEMGVTSGFLPWPAKKSILLSDVNTPPVVQTSKSSDNLPKIKYNVIKKLRRMHEVYLEERPRAMKGDSQDLSRRPVAEISSEHGAQSSAGRIKFIQRPVNRFIGGEFKKSSLLISKAVADAKSTAKKPPPKKQAVINKIKLVRKTNSDRVKQVVKLLEPAKKWNVGSSNGQNVDEITIDQNREEEIEIKIEPLQYDEDDALTVGELGVSGPELRRGDGEVAEGEPAQNKAQGIIDIIDNIPEFDEDELDHPEYVQINKFTLEDMTKLLEESKKTDEVAERQRHLKVRFDIEPVKKFKNLHGGEELLLPRSRPKSGKRLKLVPVEETARDPPPKRRRVNNSSPLLLKPTKRQEPAKNHQKNVCVLFTNFTSEGDYINDHDYLINPYVRNNIFCHVGNSDVCICLLCNTNHSAEDHIKHMTVHGTVCDVCNVDFHNVFILNLHVKCHYSYCSFCNLGVPYHEQKLHGKLHQVPATASEAGLNSLLMNSPVKWTEEPQHPLSREDDEETTAVKLRRSRRLTRSSKLRRYDWRSLTGSKSKKTGRVHAKPKSSTGAETVDDVLTELLSGEKKKCRRKKYVFSDRRRIRKIQTEAKRLKKELELKNKMKTVDGASS